VVQALLSLHFATVIELQQNTFAVYVQRRVPVSHLAFRQESDARAQSKSLEQQPVIGELRQRLLKQTSAVQLFMSMHSELCMQQGVIAE
jgi:hypothetical protein